ncbi:hypothetical protein LNP38_28270, partial [Escherichia coli]|nr:hypothetical protein [Escherichia coli]
SPILKILGRRIKKIIEGNNSD